MLIIFPKCSVCIEAKYGKKPFNFVTNSQIQLLKLVYSDLTNFKTITSKGGKRYYINFVDDYCRYTKVYLLMSKNEVEEIFLKNKVEAKINWTKKSRY